MFRDVPECSEMFRVLSTAPKLWQSNEIFLHYVRIAQKSIERVTPLPTQGGA